MLQLHLKIAIRNLLKHKSSSIISIAGLVLSFSSCLLLGLFVHHELSFDRFHAQAQNIYRLVWHLDDEVTWVPAGGRWQERLESVPEIKEVVYLDPKWGGDPFVEIGEKSFRESPKKVFRTTSNYARIFDLEYLKGDEQTALELPGSVVISSDLAEKYFPGINPIGQVVMLDKKLTLKVTGVFKPFPSNSHYQADILYNNGDQRWIWPYVYTLLEDNQSREAVDSKIDQVLEQTSPKSYADGYRFRLQPMVDIHLKSNYDYEIETNSNLLTVRTMAAIGLIILLMGCINFVNMVIAGSSLRLKEIGVKKVMGCYRSQIVRQYLIEIIITTLVSAFIALLLTVLVLPFFNELTGRHIILPLLDPSFCLIYIAIIFLVGLMAGAYPALYFSRIKAVEGLKKTFTQNKGQYLTRKIVLTFQFAASIFLIAGTIVIYEQVNYLGNRNLGFDKEQVIGITVSGDGYRATLNQVHLLKSRWQSMSDVSSVTTATSLPTRLATVGYDMVIPPNDPNEGIMMYTNSVDADFVKTLGLRVQSGTDFSQLSNKNKNSDKVMINEEAQRLLNFRDPVGHKLTVYTWRDTVTVDIIGVFENFNDRTLKEQIPPMLLFGEDTKPWYMAIRMNTDNLRKSMSELQSVWESVVTTEPFDYFFFDDAFDQLYHNEQKLGKVMNAFSFIAILIANLGTFGISFFIANQKVKEVSIRKVLGANVIQILELLNRHVLLLTILALIITIPLFRVIMSGWLDEFAYRIDLNWGTLIVSFLAVVIIAIGSGGYHTFRVARTNPVDSLGSE